MEPSVTCSPVAYVTAPTSPVDEFQFATSKNFSRQQPDYDTDFDLPESDDDQVRYKHRDSGGSLPALAFADELFLNGLVMPLKLPPRLQCHLIQRSPVLSPRTPTCRMPFARRSSWKDDFDPFLAALEKVREESRGRKSHHRRSRSYSPFRGVTKCSDDGSADFSNNLARSNVVDRDRPTVEGLTPSRSGPLDFKGSAYARWVRDQTREGISPKSPRGFFIGKRVRPVKDQADRLQDKPTSLIKNGKESKVRKLKGILLRYASFQRGSRGINGTKMSSSSSSQPCKANYFSRMSFKYKQGSAGKKRMAGDPKNMALVEYRPSSFTLCLGRGPGSPGAKAK